MGTLFFFVWSLCPTMIPCRDVPAYVGDVWTVAAEEAPLYTVRPFAGFATAELLAVWGLYESAGRADVVSPDGLDCGVIGLRLTTLATLGSSCDAVRQDRKLGFRLALRWLRLLKSQCTTKIGSAHTVECALRAYSSGSFTKAGALVAKRCAVIGDCKDQ